jgi:2-polyprenyl-3-methyl-5-hydroxy-6-metoxy-1,4-benzoquinol methylase
MNNRQKSINRQFIESAYRKEWAFTPAEQVRADVILRLTGGGKHVLDVGCYNGRIGIMLKTRHNRVFGADLSLEALKIAQHEGMVCVQSDVTEAIPFKDKTFDVVVAAEIIEHVFDLHAFLTETKRILKNGGYLVLSTPNLASFGRRIHLLFGKNPLIEIDSGVESVGHIRYFVKETLFQLLHKYGFKISVLTSDVVNFDNSGRRFCRLLARVVPGLGKSLIVKAIQHE